MGDYISREEVIKAIDAREKVDGNVCAEDIRLDICLLPSVQPAENKGEYIKREDAIDEFKAQKDAWEYYGESFYNVRYIAFDNAIETIRNLPTYSFPEVVHIKDDEELLKRLKECPLDVIAPTVVSFPEREKGEWIPVSERLPEEEQEVLCQLSDDSMAVLYMQDNWGQMDWVDGMMGTGTYDVIAWQPLPEPYKAEKGGE